MFLSNWHASASFIPICVSSPEIPNALQIETLVFPEPQGFEEEVIQKECRVERRIATMDDFKVDQEDLLSGHQHILGTVVAVDKRLPATEHRGHKGVDLWFEPWVNLGDLPVIGINAKLPESFNVLKFGKQFRTFMQRNRAFGSRFRPHAWQVQPKRCR